MLVEANGDMKHDHVIKGALGLTARLEFEAHWRQEVEPILMVCSELYKSLLKQDFVNDQ